MRSGLLLTLLLLVSGCAGTSLEIPPHAIAGTRAAKIALPGKLFLPSGTGPHPVVILLHGCDGLSPSTVAGSGMERWVSRVNGWGYAALVLDSMSPRGVSGVCPSADQPKVTVVDRSGDVVSAALYLRGIKEIDGNRIAAMGFSHGGATAARTAVAPAGAQARPLLKAAIDYYGSCAGAASYTGLPLLVLAGGDDDWGNPAATCTNFGRAVGKDQPFQVVVYPGVVHAFDSAWLIRRIVSNGHALQYDQAAAEDSFVRARAFLDRYVK